MASPWKKITNTPPFSVDTMMLLTDGSVMCHEYETVNWHKLIPDAKGDYVNGTWQTLTPLPADDPGFSRGSCGCSALLRFRCSDGRSRIRGWWRVQRYLPGRSAYHPDLRPCRRFLDCPTHSLGLEQHWRRSELRLAGRQGSSRRHKFDAHRHPRPGHKNLVHRRQQR